MFNDEENPTLSIPTWFNDEDGVATMWRIVGRLKGRCRSDNEFCRILRAQLCRVLSRSDLALCLLVRSGLLSKLRDFKGASLLLVNEACWQHKESL